MSNPAPGGPTSCRVELQSALTHLLVSSNPFEDFKLLVEVCLIGVGAKVPYLSCQSIDYKGFSVKVMSSQATLQ